MVSQWPLLVAITGALVAVAAHDEHMCPYPQVDIPLFLIGLAFAVRIHWKGEWSRALLIRSAAEAFFFRCVVLYIMGSNTVHLMAIRDAGLGLMIFGALTYAGRRTAGQDRANQGNVAIPKENIPAAVGPEAGYEHLAKDESLPAKQDEEPLRSPLQFTLKGILWATVACAVVLSLVATVGPEATFAVLLMGFIWWGFAGCVRIVRLGSN